MRCGFFGSGSGNSDGMYLRDWLWFGQGIDIEILRHWQIFTTNVLLFKKH